MNVSKENLNEQNAVLKVSIEKNDYEGRVNTVLKDYRKQANVPGFRPGMVPMGMIKKMYGKAVLVEEINKLVSENLSKFIVEEKLNILGEPLPNKDQKQIDFDKEDNFDFLFDIATVPEFELKLTKREKLNFYKIKVDDEMVDKYVEGYMKRFGNYEKTDAVVENEMVRGNFVQLDDKGKELEDGITAENVLVSLDVIKDAKAKKKFAGKKENDVVKFNPMKVYPNETEVSSMLKINKEDVSKADSDFNFTITEIQKFNEAELNQELFDQVFGEGTVKDVEGFRAKIREDVEGNLIHESDYKFMLDARDKILSKTEMELPVEFLKRWLVATNNELTNEQIEKDFPLFEKDLKWQIIKEKIVKENEIKVTEEEVLEHAKKVAEMQFKQYGISYAPDEHIENYAKEILKKEEDRQKYVEKKIEDKVIDYIKEQVKVEEKEVTSDEFNKFFETK